MTPGYLVLDDSINLHFDGKTHVIAKGDGRFDKIMKAINEKRFSDIPAIADNGAFFERQGMKVVDGVLQLDGEEMPLELSDRIMAYKENNLPITSLLSFWDNLKKNPSFNSRKQLFKFLQNKGHSLTEDGCFIGYRGVTEDFKDKHSRKFDNSPGSVCELPREQVDDNPDNTCSYGLHVGGYEYAKDFGSGGKLVLVKVNPKDVVAVPNDYDGQKMRVCRFEVLKEAEGIIDRVVFEDVESIEEGLIEATALVMGEATVPVDPQTGKPAKLSFLQTPAQKRAHKARYKNNYAKRDKTGKFVAKKKGRK
jgi:hypothetical protein